MSNQDFHTVAHHILVNNTMEEMFRAVGYRYTFKVGGPKGDPVSMDVKIYRDGDNDPVARLDALNGTNEILLTKMPTQKDIGLWELGNLSRLMSMLTNKMIEQVRGDVVSKKTLQCEKVKLYVYENEEGEGDFISLVHANYEYNIRLCDSGVEINARRVQWAMRGLLKTILKEDIQQEEDLDDSSCGEENNKFWEELREFDFKDLASKLMDASLHVRIFREVNNWQGIQAKKLNNEISEILLPPIRWNRHVSVLEIADYYNAVKKDHLEIRKF